MEVACNLAPFAAASNNNLNPIMEQATLELESSDDSNEEMPTVLEPQVHSGTFCLLCVQSGIIFCKYAVWLANNLHLYQIKARNCCFSTIPGGNLTLMGQLAL